MLLQGKLLPGAHASSVQRLASCQMLLLGFKSASGKMPDTAGWKPALPLRGDFPRGHISNPLHNFMPPEIIDHGVACLHGMQNAIRLRRVKQRSQFHEMM